MSISESKNLLTFLFPGQGSQSPGMGHFLFEQFTVVQNLFQEASDTLQQDMKKLCFEGSEKELALTENTQPALLLVSTATQMVLRKEFGIQPKAAAGHSVGEYAALVSGGVLSFCHALQAVRLRGQAMQSAVPLGKGGMIAAIGLDDSQIDFLCKKVVSESGIGPLSPANFNCPGQIVLSGASEAIQWMQSHIKWEEIPDAPRKARLIPLNVSAPFHCAMMSPAEEKMREFLTSLDFRNSEFPIVQNFHAKAETDGSVIRENLIRQICGPVLWSQSILTLKNMGMDKAIECGTGRVLTGLMKKICADQVQMFVTNSMEDLELLK